MERPDHSNEQRVRLAAVGDILLTRAPDQRPYRRAAALVSADAAAILNQCDLVFGNLECTLAEQGQRVPTEPRVIADPELIRSVKASGFDIVTLANNHMFDGLEGGFRKLQHLLAEISLPGFGAGLNLCEAVSPAVMERNGVRIAFLGAVDQASGPFRFATEESWGVAPLDIRRLGKQIRELRNEVHHVIVSVHWGEERFCIPSPEQMRQARELVDCGASMILGHHPHVLQGLETYQGAPIIYSLGNFLADDVYLSDGDFIHWNKCERTGSILLTELSRDRVQILHQIPTYDDGESVAVDPSGYGERRIRRVNGAIAGGVSTARYRREHRWIKLIRPTLAHLRPSELRHLRPSHVRNAVRVLLHSRATH